MNAVVHPYLIKPALIAAASLALCLAISVRGCTIAWRFVSRSAVRSRAPSAAAPLLASDPALSQQTAAAPLPLPSPTISSGKRYTVSLQEIGGIPTDILEWRPTAAATQGSPATIFIFFPGNPGTTLFYTSYLSRVFELSGRSLHIFCVSHAGHSATTASRLPISLATQVSHKQAFVDLIANSTHPTAKIILGGHSVGAYCAMRSLEALKDSELERRVSKLLFLFPTLIDIVRTENGEKLSPVFNHHKSAAWLLAKAVTTLPRSHRHAILRRAIPQLSQPGPDRDEALAAAESILHEDVAFNALNMAQHEMREIGPLSAADDARLKRIEGKLCFYFAERDGWVSPRSVEALSSRFRDAAAIVNCSEGHEHAFVLRPESNTRLAEVSWRWIGGQGKAAAAATATTAMPASTIAAEVVSSPLMSSTAATSQRKKAGRARSRSRSNSGNAATTAAAAH